MEEALREAFTSAMLHYFDRPEVVSHLIDASRAELARARRSMPDEQREAEKALGPGSFAIDQIPVTDCVDVVSTPLTEDQRGVPRPQGAMCDVGAFGLEVGP